MAEQRKIIISLKAVTKGFNNIMDTTRKKVQQVGHNMNTFGRTLALPMANLNMMNKNNIKIRDSGVRAANTLRLMTHGLKGFKMEALGVMFFGMMLQNTFMGFLRPVMEAYGVFELFRLMLLVLFLPTMEMLFPIMLSIMDWFMNLSEPVKQAAGIFTLFGIAIGFILFVLGTFALGIGSVIQFMPIIGTAIAKIGVLLAGLAGPLLVVGAILVALALGIYLAWKTNFMNIKDSVAMVFKGIKQIFSGVFKWISGIIKFFVALFKGDLDGMWSAVKIIGSGIKEIWKGVFNFVIGILSTIGIALLKLLSGVLISLAKFIIKILGWIKTNIKKITDAIWNVLPEWLKKLLTGGFSIVGSITDKAKGLYSGLTRKDDFIWRPGSGAISINPNDTLVGYKGDSPFGSGGGGTNITNNFYGFTNNELNRELDNRDRRIVNEIGRIVKQ